MKLSFYILRVLHKNPLIVLTLPLSPFAMACLGLNLQDSGVNELIISLNPVDLCVVGEGEVACYCRMGLV